MPGISRVNIDDASGQILGPGASTVFAQGGKVSLKGDNVAGHGLSPHNAPTMVGSSSTVFANGKPVVRKSDNASCGHLASGASTVFAG